MPFLTILGLTCRNTTLEARDEVYIEVEIDGIPQEPIWGPNKMNDGDTLDVNWRCEFDNSVCIRVKEKDRYNEDDHIGTVIIAADDADNEEKMAMLSGSHSHYELRYWVGDYSSARWEVDLISIRCIDAQESGDEILLVVNGNRVWTNKKVRTGDTKVIGQRREFRHTARIELWEEDRGANDCLGVLELPGEATDGAVPHRFRWRKSAFRDATYELIYAVRPR